MAKINRLACFMILRTIEAGILFYLWLINAYTVNNLRLLILTLAGVTVLVLIANYSRYKKHEKYKPPLDLGFLLFLFILIGLEVLFLFLAPMGYLDFVTARWIIAGIEFILGIALGFIKKLDLL